MSSGKRFSTVMAVVVTAVVAVAVTAAVMGTFMQPQVTTVTIPGQATTIVRTVASTVPVTVTAAPVTPPPVARFKVAVVSDIGGRGDLSFNDMGFKGADEAARDFGVGVVEFISKTEADYIPNLRTAAMDPEVKLIVGVGFLLSEALAEVALEFPNKYFAGIDTYAQEVVKGKHPDKYPLPNLLDIKFEEHKGSALVGALGCLLAVHYGYPHIGAVLGIEIPVLWKFEIGYKWGCNWAIEWFKRNFPAEYEAKSKAPGNILATDPRSRVLWTYTGTFSDITKGYLAAKEMYAKGAVAVYNIAGPLGLGINQAVDEIVKPRGLTMGPPFWIGVDANQDWINPGFVVASMMKRVDRGVYYATQLVLAGKFEEVSRKYGGVLTLGIGTVIEGIPMEGISVSTLADLDEFIEMGVTAERILGKPVLPMAPDEIKKRVKEMRDSVPSWIWAAVEELERLIREGKVEVPLPLTDEDVKYWRGILG